LGKGSLCGDQEIKISHGFRTSYKNQDDSDDDTLPSLEYADDMDNGDDTNDVNRDEDDDDYVRIDHDDLYPTGDGGQYFDKKGQIINGRVLAADKCAHSIDMVAVHNDLESVAEQAEVLSIGTRMLQQIRSMGSNGDAQLSMKCTLKHDGRYKARIVVGMVGE
jgi:hypothetical protein